ncbi:phosphogluconate dehydrogenase (NADP(+)-dependent, decarboxylating) [Marivirga lumbricoides]|uniref:6-phosphogluconate dehydrogenase, decarboxylating n=1 Tax=Marivirga lumbricoides TaxID=1046115 RepID=A0A2T4DL92_9BACT|nr:phosphogluconate dehydrogenase (NADP(+)-dependent, decarboxylating) [Marivirga lumbricoides]
MEGTYDFGLVGLGVMGRNFILNVADNGFSAYGLDTDPEKVDALRLEGEGKKVDGTTGKAQFIQHLSKPRKIMLLVPAGAPVDAVIADLLPLMDKGDLIIDGGNSFFTDTNRRAEELQAKGVHFIGTGVSGGAKGARFGPSIMPGGEKAAYELVKPIFEAVAAKVNGEPCVDYMGAKSAGNYVKMVHNGIEYGLMQLISEIYDVLKTGLGKNNEELHKIFTDWNNDRLKSFLIEITSEIFVQKDEETGGDLVDIILDKAKQKGTGKWTSQNAMDLGTPIPTIDVAVSMRAISSFKSDRLKAQNLYPKPALPANLPSIQDIEAALFFAFIVTYAQGMTQLVAASKEYHYELDLAVISKIWRGGCIIRAELLEDMRKAFTKKNDLKSLLLDEDFARKLNASVGGARKVAAFAISAGIPVAGLSASLSYFDAFTTGRLPLNLIQAQRDHFGSHTYERLDKEGIFHTEW